MGPLYCLTGGDGEIAWVRLDDVRTHFGVSFLNELSAKPIAVPMFNLLYFSVFLCVWVYGLVYGTTARG